MQIILYLTFVIFYIIDKYNSKAFLESQVEFEVEELAEKVESCAKNWNISRQKMAAVISACHLSSHLSYDTPHHVKTPSKETQNIWHDSWYGRCHATLPPSCSGTYLKLWCTIQTFRTIFLLRTRLYGRYGRCHATLPPSCGGTYLKFWCTIQTFRTILLLRTRLETMRYLDY